MNYYDFNLEEKDIFKLLNQVKLEESEFCSMEEEIQTIQKERIMKNLKKRLRNRSRLKAFKYTSTAAAVGLLCLIGIGTAFPALAKNVPVLNSITQTLSEKFGISGNYAEYSQVVNKSVTDQGITVTINEALADDSKLIIGYTIKIDKKIEWLQTVGLPRFLKINGQSAAATGSSRGNYIDDLTYIGSDEIHTDVPQGADRFNVELNIDDIMGTKGNWNFAFSVSKDGLAKQSTVFYPNMKLDFPDNNVSIDKVVFSPIDSAIFVSGNYKDQKRKLNIGMFDYDFWRIFDDKGVELIPKGFGTAGMTDTNSQIFEGEMTYESIQNIPKYLTVIPGSLYPSDPSLYYSPRLDANGNEVHTTFEAEQSKEIWKLIDGNYPLELPQGEVGKLIINEISTEDNTTTINFTAEGKAPYYQAIELRIKDSNGEILRPKSYVKSYAKRDDEQDPYEFTMSFNALDPNKEYWVSTSSLDILEIREDLKFKIELDN